MSKDEMARQLRKYADLLDAKTKAENALKVFEMRLKLERQSKGNVVKRGKKPNELERFKQKHAAVLINDDLLFLDKPSHCTAEIASFAEISESEARRRIREGIYRPGRGDRPRGKRMGCSMSVVEHLLTDGKADQES